MLRFPKATYLPLLFKLILSERLSKSLRGSDVLILPEIINLVSVLFHNFIEFIILLHTFLLVISFARCKEYMICLISSSKFSHVLPAFTCASDVDNL